MGRDTRPDVTWTIADAGGWYVLTIKSNQADLYDVLQRDFAHLDHSETMERGHGRHARRTSTIMRSVNGFRAEFGPNLMRVHWGIENRPQHGRPLSDHPSAPFLAEGIRSPLAQVGGPQPSPIGSPLWPCDELVNTLGDGGGTLDFIRLMAHGHGLRRVNAGD